MDEENDLFYHALNYRGAQSQHAELFWQELQACVDRLIAAEREACKRDCREVQQAHVGLVQPYHVVAGECIAAIEKRSNDRVEGPGAALSRTVPSHDGLGDDDAK